MIFSLSSHIFHHHYNLTCYRSFVSSSFNSYFIEISPLSRSLPLCPCPSPSPLHQSTYLFVYLYIPISLPPSLPPPAVPTPSLRPYLPHSPSLTYILFVLESHLCFCRFVHTILLKEMHLLPFTLCQFYVSSGKLDFKIITCVHNITITIQPARMHIYIYTRMHARAHHTHIHTHHTTHTPHTHTPHTHMHTNNTPYARTHARTHTLHYNYEEMW